MDFGLIGYPLKHSFSKYIHSFLADYKYELYELDESSFDTFMKKRDFKGINVTIPYKQKVIPYLDSISDSAKAINAVNTIVNNNGKLIGYNTDVLGIIATFSNFQINPRGNVLILGTGGTSNTAYHAFANKRSNDMQSKIYKAYRETSKIKGDILYDDIPKIYDDIEIIVNTTSNGMYPHADDPLLIDLSKFKNLKAVIDVVYNPLRTKLLIEAKKLGVKTASGLYMLIAQAYYASCIFKGEKNKLFYNTESDIICQKIYKSCIKEKQNIVLTGMPTCGKTTIGKKVASRLGLEFIDIDTLIEKEINQSIKTYIEKYGEESFRDVEAKVIKDISLKNKVVIATGGGAILRDENVTNLKLNGKIYFMNRSIALLHPDKDRPLTNNYAELKKKYDERLPIYKKTCDVEIDGDLDEKERVSLIAKEYEI